MRKRKLKLNKEEAYVVYGWWLYAEEKGCSQEEPKRLGEKIGKWIDKYGGWREIKNARNIRNIHGAHR